MSKALDKVVDAIDIETFLYCQSEEEARNLSERLMQELNLPQSDIVFLDFSAWGARVRIRSYIHHPGDHYRWMEKGGEG
jgi:sulfopyruvate decarboxylase TPP-binding subunit